MLMLSRTLITMGWIEIASIMISFVTLSRIDQYPMILLFLPILVVPIGILTLKRIPMGRSLNLLLSPIIVFTYCSGFMMLVEMFITAFKIPLILNQWHFGVLFLVAIIGHLFFFSNPKIKGFFVARGK
jgi:hypothetical protein